MRRLNPVATGRERQVTVRRPGGADRILDVLRRLADHPRGVGLERLAGELELPKSSVHRALAVLRRNGFVDHDERGSYRLGLEFVRLAFAYYDRLDRPAAVGPALDALSARFGETAHYGELDGGEIIYLAKVTPAGRGAQMTSLVGGRNPAHCTGLGKALLAYTLETPKAVEGYVEAHGPLTARTKRTLTDAQALARDLRRIRRRGYALDREENEAGIVCLAIPLFLDGRDRPTGAISIAALAHRTPLAELERAAGEAYALVEAALGEVTA